MYSKTTIIGNLGMDPEVRYTQNQKPVANFSVGVNTGSGEFKHTEWFKVVAWNKLAETAEKYLKKGAKVLVEGEMRTKSWEKDDGSKIYSTELIARNFSFLDKKSDDNQNNSAPNNGDSDIPF